MFASKDTLLTRPSGYNIARSVRLRQSATAYLTRTPASAGNQKTWTWSSWVKRGIVSGATQQNLFSVDVGTTDTTSFQCTFSTSNTLYIVSYTASLYLETTQVFRDPSAWYHIVVSLDTTQATSSNRAKIYVNGTQVTALSSAVYPSQNSNYAINIASPFDIGRFDQGGGVYFFDGYLTEINFIDGQALTPSSFGETDSITGVWKPKAYSGTYGTNGFELNFSDNSSNTATTIGKDYSGNGNNWTPNNISVTSGVTYDSMVDSPTVGSLSSNYCVMNPLKTNASAIVLTNGNLKITSIDAGSAYCAFGSIAMTSGKWYWEFTITAVVGGYPNIGIGDLIKSPTANEGVNGTKGVSYNNGGAVVVDSTTIGTYSSFTTGDVIGIAYDADNNRVYFAKNNTWQNSAVPSSGTGYFSPSSPTLGYVACASTYGSGVVDSNFGQRPFSYTPPTGFVALNTYNLPASTIKNGAAYMAATTYTGTGAALTVSNAVNGVSFQPDFVWFKNRASAYSHLLYDSIRGTSLYLSSNTTGAEVSYALGLTAFNSNGFSVGTDPASNESTKGIVGWQWKAGGTSASNTNGSITSTVSVGATQGFSVVTFSGASAGTVGHGLGVAPKMIFIKTRTTVLGWYVYTETIGANGWLQLNTSAAAVTGNPAAFGGTAPTSTVFSYGSGLAGTGNYVAYCFSAVAGYSAFGSYTGNGSTDGPFVFTNFQPRWIMIKRSDSGTEAWNIFDTSRDLYNVEGQYLQANSAGGEGTASTLDALSNGFKIRASGLYCNASGGTYIYACFASNPLKYANAR